MTHDKNAFTDALRLAEALLFASPAPVAVTALAERLPDTVNPNEVLDSLQQHYAVRGINLVKVGEAYAFRTAPELAGELRLERTEQRKLSRAAMEVLSIIAYHQPVTRAEIEEIRGVALGTGTMDILLQAGWIKPHRRRITPGRPMTWVTTQGFLDHFGLESLDMLPGLEELQAAGFLEKGPAILSYRNQADEEQIDLFADDDMDDGQDELPIDD